jgi:hypothetical protein
MDGSIQWFDLCRNSQQREEHTMIYTKPEVLTPTAATSTIQGGVEKAGGMIRDSPDSRTNNPAYEDE